MRKGFSKKGGFFSYLFVGIVLLALDLFSKYWVSYELPHSYYTTPFYPYGGIGIFQNVLGIDFCINRVTNFGGAWGIFSSYPIVLLIVRIASFFGILTYALFLNDEKRRKVPLLLVLVGALGNIVDCLVYGSVVDMLHFTLWGYAFPVFNFADTMICLGVFSLIFQSLFYKKKKHAASFSN
jgi:signal peptidase II